MFNYIPKRIGSSIYPNNRVSSLQDGLAMVAVPSGKNIIGYSTFGNGTSAPNNKPFVVGASGTFPGAFSYQNYRGFALRGPLMDGVLDFPVTVPYVTQMAEATFMALVYPTLISTTNSILFALISTTNPNTNFGIFQSSVASQLQFFAADDAATVQQINAAHGDWISKRPVLLIARRSAKLNVHELYVNGAPLSANTTYTALGAFTPDQLTIFFAGGFHLGALWNRAVLPWEIQALTLDPFAVLGNDRSRILLSGNYNPDGPVNYPVTLSPISYSYSLQTLTPPVGRKATLSPLAYSFTVKDLTARYGRVVTLSPLSFNLSLQALTTQLKRRVTLSPLSFAYSVQSLSAATGRKVTLSPLTYNYALSALTPSVGRKVTLSSLGFSFGLSNLNVTYTPGGGAVNYSVTLSPVSFAFTLRDLSVLATSTATPGGYPYDDAGGRPKKKKKLVFPYVEAPQPAEPLPKRKKKARLEKTELEALRRDDLQPTIVHTPPTITAELFEKYHQLTEEDNVAKALDAAAVDALLAEAKRLRKVREEEEEKILASFIQLYYSSLI